MNTIQFEIKDAVGILRFNRPDKFNAFNRGMALNFQHILHDCATDENIRAVYITGNGKAFSAGQDLGELIEPDAPGFDTILKEHYNPIVRIIRNMEKPVVAAVNGVAAGAAANIALCCDIVVAAASSSFIQAFSKIGLIPDSGGTYFLPRLVGWQKASAMMLLGEKISAVDAEKMGMIFQVFPDDVFATSSLQIATSLATLPGKGLALTKKALQESFQNSFEAQLQLEDQLQFIASQTKDFQEAVNAFMEKRKPIFKGA